jgi:hypothetical protein
VRNGFTQPLDFDREAVPGTTCANALTAVTSPTGTDGHTVARFYNKYRRVSVVSLGCGANDFNSGRTAAATIADIQAWVAAVQSNAPLSKIWVQTVADHVNMNANGGAGYTWKNTVNAAIRAISGISIVDVGADANLGCDGCSANLTYFNSDGVHLSGTNGVPPDSNNNGIVAQSNLAITVMSSMGFQ